MTRSALVLARRALAACVGHVVISPANQNAQTIRLVVNTLMQLYSGSYMPR